MVTSDPVSPSLVHVVPTLPWCVLHLARPTYHGVQLRALERAAGEREARLLQAKLGRRRSGALDERFHEHGARCDDGTSHWIGAQDLQRPLAEM